MTQPYGILPGSLATCQPDADGPCSPVAGMRGDGG